ncbi:MAG: hypothetical protein M1480_18685 [Bacteroidetes bacterium]|nr:hypothetical protein [Bacteroidota bacterium]
MKLEFQKITTNWRTSVSGILSIIFGFYIAFKSNDWAIAAPFISTGIGLLAAKDGN